MKTFEITLIMKNIRKTMRIISVFSFHLKEEICSIAYYFETNFKINDEKEFGQLGHKIGFVLNTFKLLL